MKTIQKLFLCLFTILVISKCPAQQDQPAFKIIAFFTAQHDRAHISFVHEANKWFPAMARIYHFRYDSTNNWNNLNDTFLARYDIVLFLDSRPEQPAQRKAFETYMRKGGAWMGFHFAAFAMPGSACPDNWPWYHDQFLGSGNYVSNTWRPTAALLKTEQKKHPVLKGMPSVFTSAPNEWYRWQQDLRKNPDIDILLSIDPASFPLGTGPKPQEIWHNGYYPVAWSNKKYRMVYVNMGHNDIDYEHHTNQELSFTFTNPVQNQLVLNTLLWLGNGVKNRPKN